MPFADEAHIVGALGLRLLPHIKVTELLLEVDEWTGFTRHFTHFKSGDTAKDRILLLAVTLAD
jgi:Tn3 transposase DDE domain